MQRAPSNVTASRLFSARDRAVDDLLSDLVMAQALTAESGTGGFGYENIVGVGIAERFARGHPTGENAVSVYVVRKAPLESVAQEALVPKEYEGIPTDVIDSGEFVAFTERGRHRPAPSGVSIAHVEDTAGTLGFVGVRGSEFVVVSNNHVLARENRGRIGDAILQPGPADGGTPADQIGTLAGFHPLDLEGSNTIDAAYAGVERDAVSADIFGIGTFVPEPLEPRRDMIARKCGRTTGITRGLVRDANATMKVRYPSGTVRLRDQVVVRGLDDRPFSASGDSGSLVLDDQTRQPIGLLCGGSTKFSLVNRMQPVLDGLGVSLAT